MFTYLKNLWDKIIGYFTPAEDKRPDPEDPIVYAHLEKLLWSLEAKGGVFQLLRDQASKPTDVEESWADVKEQGKVTTLPTPVGYACWLDVYEGPKGRGFVVNYETKRKGTVFQKAINLGPEDWREQDWTEIKEPLDVTRR